jgi:hypothetical protein
VAYEANLGKLRIELEHLDDDVHNIISSELAAQGEVYDARRREFAQLRIWLVTEHELRPAAGPRLVLVDGGCGGSPTEAQRRSRPRESRRTYARARGLPGRRGRRVSSDIGIRLEASRSIKTTFTPATVSRLEGQCSHGRAAWRIDGQLWHVSTVERDQEFLVPCAKGTDR